MARQLTPRSQAAWDAFRARVAELGGEVLEPRWLGTQKPHRIRCVSGHVGAPYPTGILYQGGGICRACVGLDTQSAETAFRERLLDLGATLLEPEWLGTQKPHRVRCAAGHEGETRPNHVRQGRGVCRVCSGNDPRSAEARFRARVTELGGEVLEPWKNNRTPIRVRCAAGHESTPWPNYVQQGGGICRTCAYADYRHPSLAVAWDAFRARVAELGGEVLEPKWLGARRPHRVRCGAGHECAPWPSNVKQGVGICRVCAGRDPQEAESAFRARLIELGAILLESEWLGSDTPHRMRCAAGHEVSPMPSNVQKGAGICRVCAGKTWDAFYVVADDVYQVLKFGITSGDPRPRLGDHKRDGLDRVVRLLTGMPGSGAPDLEQSCLAAFKTARVEPVRGREYFPLKWLPLVLGVVDKWAAPVGDV